MNILYISIGVSTAGVRKKLEDKVTAIREQGVSCRLCVVVPHTYTGDNTAETDVVKVDYTPAERVSQWPLLWRLSVVIEQWLTYRELHAYLRHQQMDLIVFRYPVAEFFLARFMRHYKNKIVFEHNTMEIEELSLRAHDSFWYRYFLSGEKRFGKRVRAMAAGLIGVTPEITQRQVDTAERAIPHETISNGIKVDRVPVRKENNFNGKALNLLLLSGSEAPWHGIDILLNSIASYKGDCVVHCYIAGNISSDVRKRAESLKFVTLLPSQSGEALDRLVDQCHVGVGTLGLSSKFMRQACPLKVREYWSRGLPFIIGYEDVDLEGNTAMECFYCRIHVDESGSFAFDEVVNFANNLYRIPHVSGTMRDLAFQYIDYPVKTAAYVRFLKGLKA